MDYLAYNVATSTAVSGLVPFDTESYDADGHSLTASLVRIAEAGLYLVEYSVSTIVTVGTSRTSIQADLRQNGGGVIGASTVLYNRQLNYGATGHASAVVTAAASDTFGVFGTRTAGSSTVNWFAGGCRIMITRLG